MKYIRRLIIWAFSFFPSSKSITSPVIELKPEQIKQLLPTISEGIHLTEGSAWNPILKYPRNAVCYCGSGLKAKKCCILRQPLAVSSEFAEKAAPLVKTLRSER